MTPQNPTPSIPPALAARAAEMAKANPATPPQKSVAARIPLSLPTLKLAVPEIPGYVCRWFRGTGGRLQQALAGGYVYVEKGEVQLVHGSPANDYASDGNSDMGTRVSISAGAESDGDQGLRLYLMKIKQELWDEDQQGVDARHEAIAAQLRGDKGFAEAGQDASHRYSRGEQKRHMFQPRRA